MSIIEDLQEQFNRICKLVESIESLAQEQDKNYPDLKEGDLILLRYESFMRSEECIELVRFLKYFDGTIWFKTQNGLEYSRDLGTCRIQTLTEKEKMRLYPPNNIGFETRSGTVVYWKQKEEERFSNLGVFIGFKGLKALIVPISDKGYLAPDPICVNYTFAVNASKYDCYLICSYKDFKEGV